MMELKKWRNSALAIGIAGAAVMSSGVAMAATPKPAAKMVITMMDWQGQNPAYWNGYEYIIHSYEKTHPGVTIDQVFVPNTTSGYTSLLDTQYLAHKGPDLVQLFGGWANNYMNEGYLLPLNSYLAQPNPYVSKSKSWLSTFVGGAAGFQGIESGNTLGQVPFIPIDGGQGVSYTVPFYYNKNILKASGITSLPTNWNQLMADSAKIKKAGYIPFAADQGRWLAWVNSFILGRQMGEGYMQKFYPKQYAIPQLAGDLQTALVFTGKIGTSDPLQISMLKLLKSFSQYWQSGWVGTNQSQAQQLFMYNQAAFLMDGNWNYGYYVNAIRGFKWGVMGFPSYMLTKKDSPYAAGASSSASSNQGTGFSVNAQLAKDPAKLKVVMNFLQYATSVPVQTQFDKIAVTTPQVVGAPTPPAMKSFVIPPKYAKLTLQIGGIPYFDLNSSNGLPLLQNYLTGQITLQKYLSTSFTQIHTALQQQLTNTIFSAKTGLPSQIAAMQATLKKDESSHAPAAVLASDKSSLALAQLRYQFYMKYVWPSMKG